MPEFRNQYKGKRVLVTGHTGFKGSWLSQWLLELGSEVAGYSLYVPSQPSHFEVMNLSKNMRDITGDVCNIEDLQKAFDDFQPQIVFHLAAQPIVRTALKDPQNTFYTNVMGMVNVLEVIRKSSSVQAAVLITSDKCYENVEWEFGYRENDRLGGKDPYSASKACAEIVASSYVRSYFKGVSGAPGIATARAGNVIGGGDWAADRIIPDCVRSWADGVSPILRAPNATRPWQHVLEPLSGYLLLGAELLLRSETLMGEAFNFGPPAEVNSTVADLIEKIIYHWKNPSWNLDPKSGELAKKEATLLKLCCDKAQHQLGWLPTLTYDETVKMTAEWYMSFYDKKASNILTSKQIQHYTEVAKQGFRKWAIA